MSEYQFDFDPSMGFEDYDDSLENGRDDEEVEDVADEEVVEEAPDDVDDDFPLFLADAGPFKTPGDFMKTVPDFDGWAYVQNPIDPNEFWLLNRQQTFKLTGFDTVKPDEGTQGFFKPPDFDSLGPSKLMKL